MKYFLNRIHFNWKSELSEVHLAQYRQAVLLLLLVNFLVTSANGQSFYRYKRSGQMTVYGGFGLTKYFGELSNDKQLGDVNPYLSIGMNIPWKSRWSLRPELTLYRISAADSDLPESDSRKSRNLSFKSNNLELVGLVVYSLHTMNGMNGVSKLRPYLQAGIGVTYSNPKAELQGTWYQLHGLYTEGIEYQKFHLVLPVGLALGYQVTDQWMVAVEMTYRLTFTDYLDDVSTTYRDPNSFSDPIAGALADRRPEIGLDKAPTGSPRGNSDSNDGYMLFGVKVFHTLPGKGPLRRKW